ELRRPRAALGEVALLVRRRLVLLAFVQLDAVVDEVRVEVFDLLLGQLHLLEPGHDLVAREEALLLSFDDELVELFDVGERDVDREQIATSAFRHPCDKRPCNEKSRKRFPLLRPELPAAGADSTYAWGKVNPDVPSCGKLVRRVLPGC